MSSCTASSIISRNIMIGYGSIYGTLLIMVSIYSYRFLMRNDLKFATKSCFKKAKMWGIDIWKRKSCYIPIIAHLFDQITDISVAIQFYELSREHSGGGYQSCNGLNIWYLFVLTILSLVIYRIITSYLIYQYTNKSFARALSQLFDLELLRALYINYLCNSREPCSPQRWLTALEAVLESTPQAVIQLIYLLKTGTFRPGNIIFIVSLASSLWNIISKLVSDDKATVIKQAETLNFKHKHKCFVVQDILLGLLSIILGSLIMIIGCALFTYYGFIEMSQYAEREYDDDEDIDSKKYDEKNAYERWSNRREYEAKIEYKYTWSESFYDDYQRFGCFSKNFQIFTRVYIDQFTTFRSFSWFYVFRVIWRILDISSRIFLILLIWLIIGGFYLAIIISFELIAFILISWKTSHWELMIGIVAMIVSLTDNTQKISAAVFVYRTITNYVWMILVTVFLFVDFECVKCTDYADRYLILSNDSIVYAFIYCWISVVLCPVVFSLLIIKGLFKNGATTSRNLEQMLDSKNYDGVLELQLFVGQYGVYEKSSGHRLLRLAMQQKRFAVILHLITGKHKDNLSTAANENILDYYSRDGASLSATILCHIQRLYPDLKDKSGRNTFLCAVYKGNEEAVVYLLATDKTLILSSGIDNDNVLDCYVSSDGALTGKMLCDIQRSYPDLKDKSGRNAFLCAVYKDNGNAVTELLEIDKTLLFSAGNNYNVLDCYTSSKGTLASHDQILCDLQQSYPDLKDKFGRNAFLCAAYKGRAITVGTMIEAEEKIMLSADIKNQGIYHYAADSQITVNIFGTIDPQTFYENYPYCLRHDGHSVFFEQCQKKNHKIIQQLVSKYPSLLDRRDQYGNNVLDFIDDLFLFGDVVRIIEKNRPFLKDKNGNGLSLYKMKKPSSNYYEREREYGD